MTKATERVLAVQEQSGPYENVQVLPAPRRASQVPSESPTGLASVSIAKVVSQPHKPEPHSQTPPTRPKTKSKSPPPVAPKPVLSGGDPKLRLASSDPKAAPPVSIAVKTGSAPGTGTGSRTPKGTPPPPDTITSAPGTTREATRTAGGLFDSIFHRARSPALPAPEKKRSSPNK